MISDRGEIVMEEEQMHPVPDDPEPERGKEVYQPRPWWQVWGARILVVVFIILVIMYYINIARGGL